MKTFCIAVSLLLAIPAMAAETTGEYPVCSSQQAIQEYSQARLFKEHDKMQALLESGECVTIEPDVNATVTESSFYPKVIVLVPYAKPITGWTNQAGLQGN